MNWFKKVIPVLALLLLVGLFLLPNEVQAVEGTCGDDLTWTLDLEGNLIISGSGAMTDFGPSYAENVSVPWAGNRADIKTVVIEEGVTSIGNNAFVACSNLTSITIADSVTRIGEHAFKNCIKLSAIHIPDGVTDIGEYAFSGCKGLSSVTIPDGVTGIENFTFENCTGLTEIILSDSITDIGRNAFKYCPSLTSIEIPDGVTSIGRSSFQECTGLISIVLPESVTSIGSYAFDGCENFGHILYSGTAEQWTVVTLGSDVISDNVAITHNYVTGMEYHAYDSDCDGSCNHCGYTRNAEHAWDDGVTNEDTTVTFTCTACGETKVEGTPVDPTVPTEPAVPSEPTEPSEPTTHATQPGTSEPSDNGSVSLVTVIVAVVLAAGVGAALLIAKKKS